MFKKGKLEPDFSYIADEKKRESVIAVHEMYEERERKYAEYNQMQKRKKFHQHIIVGSIFLLFNALFISLVWFMGIFDALRESSGFVAVCLKLAILSMLYVASFWGFLKLVRVLGFYEDDRD